MKLCSIQIKHFRGIKDSKIILNNLCCLVGENNSGKSTVLRALNSFFNFKEELKFFISGQHLYSRQSNPQVKIVFSSDTPPENLRHLFNGNLLKLTFIYQRAKSHATYRAKVGAKTVEVSESEMSYLKGHISFVLVPPVRDHSRILEQEKGILAELIKAYLAKHTQKRDQLSPKVVQNAQSIERGVFQKIAEEIESLYFLNNEFEFSLGFKETIDYRHMIRDYQLKVKEHNQTFLLEDCGSGIQSLTLIALYRYLGKLKNSNYILGIEEPETNLHPQAQRDFVNSIKSGIEDNEAGNIQAIISTHSPVIVDQVNHEEVVLCKRRPDSIRGFHCFLSQINESFWSEYKIEESKHYQFYRYKNSEFFFAKHVILCEGKSDAEVIKYLAKDVKVDLDALGITILEAGGVGSYKYPIALFSELGMPCTVIVDRDFFLPLKNERLDESRDSMGFPQYKKEFVKQHNGIIEKTFKTKVERDKLLKLFFSNHSKALDVAEQKRWVVFKWNLETDLVNSRTARTHYYELFKIPAAEHSSKTLLVNHRESIKKTENILKILDNLDTSNLPHSYSRIRKVIKRLSKSEELIPPINLQGEIAPVDTGVTSDVQIVVS